MDVVFVNFLNFPNDWSSVSKFVNFAILELHAQLKIRSYSIQFKFPHRSRLFEILTLDRWDVSFHIIKEASVSSESLFTCGFLLTP